MTWQTVNNPRFYGLAAGAVVAGFSAVATAAAPQFSGNTDIARRIKQGDAHVVLLGDSLQNASQGEYLRRWPVQNFSGQFIGENVGQNTGAYTWPHFSEPWLGAHATYLPDSPPAPDGYTGIAPSAVYHARFNAQPAAADQNLLSNRVYAMQLAPNPSANYFDGNWANRSDGQLKVDLLVYANPEGLSSGLKLEVHGNSLTTPLAATPISTHSATPEIRRYSLTWDAEAWDPGVGLSATIRMEAGTTPAQDSNLIVLGSRFHTGETGFQMTNIAWGGKLIDYYLEPSHTSEANLAKFLEYTDSNVALIQIGANGSGSTDKQQHKAQMQELIARYRQAKPDMQFALISNFDLGTPVFSDYADALHEIAQSDPSVLFLNLYGAAGSFEYLDENYLADGVHPTAEGSRYMADTLWGLIDSAATSNVPEPTGLAMVGAGALLLLRRHRRERRSA